MTDHEQAIQILQDTGDHIATRYAGFASKYPAVFNMLVDKKFCADAFQKFLKSRDPNRDEIYQYRVMIKDGHRVASHFLRNRIVTDEWKEFVRIYPTVARLVLQERYDRRAFEKYVKRCTTIGCETKKLAADREADYVFYLAVSEGKSDADAKIEANALRDSLIRPEVKSNYQEAGQDPCVVAGEMWQYYQKKSQDADWKDKPYSEKQTVFRIEGYGEFIRKYMIVSRKIIDHGEFSMKAFKFYLRGLRTKGFNSAATWAEREADYVFQLWREYNPRGDMKVGHAIRQQTQQDLQKDVESFKETYEDAKVKVAEQKKKADGEYRQDILEAAKRDPAFWEKLLAQLRAAQTTSTSSTSS